MTDPPPRGPFAIANGRVFIGILLMLMLIYLTISLSISAVMNWYNNKVKLVER